MQYNHFHHIVESSACSVYVRDFGRFNIEERDAPLAERAGGRNISFFPSLRTVYIPIFGAIGVGGRVLRVVVSDEIYWKVLQYYSRR